MQYESKLVKLELQNLGRTKEYFTLLCKKFEHESCISKYILGEFTDDFSH